MIERVEHTYTCTTPEQIAALRAANEAVNPGSQPRIMGGDLFTSGHAWRNFGTIRASWRCKWCGVKRTTAARETVCEGK